MWSMPLMLQNTTLVFGCLSLSLLTVAALKLVRRRLELARAQRLAEQVIKRNGELFCQELEAAGTSLLGLVGRLAGAAGPDAMEREVAAFAHGAILSPDAVARLNQRLAAVKELSNHEPVRTPFTALLEPATLLETALTQSPTAARAQIVGWRSLHTRRLRGDDARLALALTQLIRNACEAAGDRGQLWLETRDDERGDVPFVTFVIGNTGPSIPSKLQSLVFEPFFSANKPGGLGLGLAVAKKVAAAHGGHICLQNSGQRGTEVLLMLPAALTPSRYKPQALPRATGWSLASALPA